MTAAHSNNLSAAYAKMYLRNPAVYKWADMAALTSAAVGRGSRSDGWVPQLARSS